MEIQRMDLFASPIIQERITGLRNDLDKSVDHHNKNLRRQSLTLKLMMISTVFSSILAGFGGVFLHWNQQVVGALAFVPGMMAFTAGALRLPERSARHKRCRDRLEGLRHRLRFELPESPTADNVASISKDLRALREQMREEGEALDFNWNHFKSLDTSERKAERHLP